MSEMQKINETVITSAGDVTSAHLQDVVLDLLSEQSEDSTFEVKKIRQQMFVNIILQTLTDDAFHKIRKFNDSVITGGVL